MNIANRRIATIAKNFVERHLVRVRVGGSVRVFDIDDEFPANCKVEFWEENSGWRVVHIFFKYLDGEVVLVSVGSIDDKNPLIHYARG